MREFKPAPEGQPTESIKTMLAHSEKMVAEWALSLKKHEEGFLRAQKALDYWKHQYDQQKWQIEQRGEEINGL